jgi:hypothetical protein
VVTPTDPAAAYLLTLRSTPALSPFCGAFCIPNALSGGRRIWTPAYGNYSSADRAAIRSAFQARRYTHIPINVAAKEGVYLPDYGPLADDPARFLRDLTELQQAGLIPVVFATDDTQGGRIADAFLAHSDKVQVAVCGWEQNQWLTEAQQWSLVARCLSAAPGARWYLHFSPGHSALGSDESGSWRTLQSWGIKGKLDQQDHFGDPMRTGLEMESIALRLAGHVGVPEPLNYYHPWEQDTIPAVWRGLHLETVRFEQTTTMTYHRGMSEAEAVAFDTTAKGYAPTTVGFCDGGHP